MRRLVFEVQLSAFPDGHVFHLVVQEVDVRFGRRAGATVEGCMIVGEEY